MDAGKGREQERKLSLPAGFWYIPALAVRFTCLDIGKGHERKLYLLTSNA